MRIGILTFHAAHNYGAVLQCFALQTALQAMGHDVSVIDYRIPSMLRTYRVFDWRRFVATQPAKMLRKIRTEAPLLFVRKRRSDAFEHFINTRLRLVPVSTITQRPFDYIVVGSDQVWNTKLTGGFDSYFWGGFPRPAATKLISYAASRQDTWSKEEASEIASRLNYWDAISVREHSLQAQLQELMPEKAIKAVADPTCLLSLSEWSKQAVAPAISEPYLFFYQVEASPKALLIAKTIAEELHLRLVCLSAHVGDVCSPEAEVTSPEQFVGWFKHASFVVCTSFHGTVFSLIFRRPFFSIRMNKGKDNRVLSLLEKVGMTERFITEYHPGTAQGIAEGNSVQADLRKVVLPSVAFLSEQIPTND